MACACSTTGSSRGSPARAHTTATPFKVAAGQTLPRVDVIYAHAGMSPDLIDAAVANGAKGLVIAGVGDGNMTTPALDAVKRAIAKGVVVVRSSRVGEGIIRRNIEVDDDKVGTVVSKELNPSKARVLLKLALTQTSEPKTGSGDVRQVLSATDAMELGLAHWLVETLRASPGARRLLRAGGRVRGRGVESGRIHARQRDRDPAGRCPHRPARDHGGRTDQVHLLSACSCSRSGTASGHSSSEVSARKVRVRLCFSLDRPRALPRSFRSLCAIVAGLDVGYAAGLYAGSQTISAAIGVATDQIDRLGYPAAQAKAYADAIPIGYAVTYIFGTIGSAIVLAQLGPKLIGVDLAAACAEYERKLGAGSVGSRCRASCPPIAHIELRAYRIDAASGLTGRPVRELFPGLRVFVERVRRGDELIDADADTVLQPGDVAAISGPRQMLVEQIEAQVPEVHDPVLLNLPATVVDVFVTNRAFSGKTLRELADEPFARGVYLRRITRNMVEMPILPETEVLRGDILTVAGSVRHVDAAVKALGYRRSAARVHRSDDGRRRHLARRADRRDQRAMGWHSDQPVHIGRRAAGRTGASATCGRSARHSGAFRRRLWS